MFCLLIKHRRRDAYYDDGNKRREKTLIFAMRTATRRPPVFAIHKRV